MLLGEIAYNIVLPIFLVVGIAMLLDRQFAVDPGTLSRLILYLFTPFTILEGIAFSELQGTEAAQLVSIALGGSLLVALVAWLVTRSAHYEPRLASAFILTATLVNAGNFGLAFNRFAFGAQGEERALIFFAATVVVSYTLGVFLASRGTVSTRRAALRVFTVPLPYAVLVGLAVNFGGIDVPLPFRRVIGLLSDATVPCMLVMLGIQLRRATIRGKIQPILLASGVRLLVGPLIALALAMLLDVHGLTRQVAIIQLSMPTAVVSGVLAVEFGADVDFVTGVILFDTLASMFTLTVVLALIT